MEQKLRTRGSVTKAENEISETLSCRSGGTEQNLRFGGSVKERSSSKEVELKQFREIS